MSTPKGRSSESVRISDEVKALLDKHRHPGQSYDGVLRELLQRLADLEEDKR